MRHLPIPHPKTLIKDFSLGLGAVAAGFSVAEPVDRATMRRFDNFIESGAFGEMHYLERYRDIRSDPRLLLPGAATVISLAFPYRPPGGYHHQLVADYALGQDYHTVLKERLNPLVRFMAENYGAQSRVCVDTAPILERYWAQKSGVGFIGQNSQLIVPGVGSGVFLAEIVTTLRLEPDAPLDLGCDNCGKCARACPGQAISPNGFDARKCHSYLSIEYRGPFPSGFSLGQCVYGCDICQRVCPHNRPEPPEPLPEFLPDPRLVGIDRQSLENLTSGDWRRLSRDSAMSRISFRQLKRNLQG